MACLVAEIGLDHSGCTPDFGRRALADPLSVIENHTRRMPSSRRHVVLDQQYGDAVVIAQTAHRFANASLSSGFHAGGGSSSSRSLGLPASGRAQARPIFAGRTTGGHLHVGHAAEAACLENAIRLGLRSPARRAGRRQVQEFVPQRDLCRVNPIPTSRSHARWPRETVSSSGKLRRIPIAATSWILRSSRSAACETICPACGR